MNLGHQQLQNVIPAGHIASGRIAAAFRNAWALSCSAGGLVRQVKAETGLPVRALLRPRFGDFCYDRYELAQMAETAAALVQAGADGIVTGVLTPEGELDVDALRPSTRPPGPLQRPLAIRSSAPCTVPLMSAKTPLRRWKRPKH